MSEIKRIVSEMKSIFDGPAWHGPSLQEILDGVTAEKALSRPIANGHSIWDLVLHIGGWEEVWRRRLLGQETEEPEEGDFPEITGSGSKEWEEARQNLANRHHQFLQVIAGLPDSDLDGKVTGENYNVRFLLRGAIRHMVYHSGQILLLKK